LLTLTRKQGESVRIGDDICIVVKEIKGKQIRLGITAPKDVYVVREELFQKIQEANQEAASQGKNPIVSEQSLEVLKALFATNSPASTNLKSFFVSEESQVDFSIDLPSSTESKDPPSNPIAPKKV
jgi:carbon storage regulator